MKVPSFLKKKVALPLLSEHLKGHEVLCKYILSVAYTFTQVTFPQVFFCLSDLFFTIGFVLRIVLAIKKCTSFITKEIYSCQAILGSMMMVCPLTKLFSLGSKQTILYNEQAIKLTPSEYFYLLHCSHVKRLTLWYIISAFGIRTVSNFGLHTSYFFMHLQVTLQNCLGEISINVSTNKSKTGSSQGFAFSAFYRGR